MLNVSNDLVLKTVRPRSIQCDVIRTVTHEIQRDGCYARRLGCL